MALTERSCRAIVCTDKNKRYPDAHGLNLLAHANGSKYWVGRYKINGKERTKSLGQYPEVSLAEAREQWTLFRYGPKKDKKAPSFAEVFLQLKGYRERGGKKYSNYFPRYYNKLPTWFTNMAVDAITRRIIADMMPLFFDNGQKVEARFVHRVLMAVFELAIDLGYIEENPSSRIAKILPKVETKHYTSMDKRFVGQYVLAINRNSGEFFEKHSLFAKLNMLTVVRMNELRTARWQDIDLEEMVWRIPAELMKMNRPHVVPLSTQAAQLFKQLHEYNGGGDILFTATRKDAVMPKSATGWYIEKIGMQGKHTTHGNRALFATVMQEEFGCDYKVIDLQLAHSTTDGVTAAYDRATFMDKRRALMQQWADWIDEQAMSAEGSVGGLLYPYIK